MSVTSDVTDSRRAYVAPAVASLRDGWEMYDELADEARRLGAFVDERQYRERAQRSRDRATRLLKLAG